MEGDSRGGVILSFIFPSFSYPFLEERIKLGVDQEIQPWVYENFVGKRDRTTWEGRI